MILAYPHFSSCLLLRILVFFPILALHLIWEIISIDLSEDIFTPNVANLLREAVSRITKYDLISKYSAFSFCQ
jgi:hypothetical protein